MAKIFISHSSKDKPFVTRLATDLAEVGHEPWLDEWQIQVGDCIVKSISDGLNESEYVIVVLSPNSVASGWVEREWAPLYWSEIASKRRCILPVLISECAIPVLLRTRKYADFRRGYGVGFAQLTCAIGPVLMQEPEPDISSTDEVLLELIGKAQTGDAPLSSAFAATLAWAARCGHRDLREFCERELVGYRTKILPKSDPVYPTHREITGFMTASAEVNLQYVGWSNNADRIFEWIRKDENFIETRMIVPFSIAQIESMVPSERPRNAIGHVVARVGDVVPDSSIPDAPMHIYTRADVHRDVLVAIRNELTRRLLAFLSPAQ